MANYLHFLLYFFNIYIYIYIYMLIQCHHHRQKLITEQLPYEDNILYSCMQAPWSDTKHATTETASVTAKTSTEQQLAHDQHM